MVTIARIFFALIPILLCVVVVPLICKVSADWNQWFLFLGISILVLGVLELGLFLWIRSKNSAKYTFASTGTPQSDPDWIADEKGNIYGSNDSSSHSSNPYGSSQPMNATEPIEMPLNIEREEVTEVYPTSFKSNVKSRIYDSTEQANMRKVNRFVEEGVFTDDQGRKFVNDINKNSGNPDAQNNLAELLRSVDKKRRRGKGRLF